MSLNVQLSNSHLGHELDPAAGRVVNGVQLLQEGAGVGHGEVAVNQTPDDVIVRGIQ